MTVKNLALCSVLAAVTAILQLSAVFVPVFGNVLSVFCTLPVAIATYIRPAGGIFTTAVAALLVLIIQPPEALVLLFTTAPLGWLLGAGLIAGRPRWLTIAAGSIVFFAGTSLLAYTAGRVMFGSGFGNAAFYKTLIVNALFSLLYTAIWEVFVRRMVTRLSLYIPYLAIPNFPRR